MRYLISFGLGLIIGVFGFYYINETPEAGIKVTQISGKKIDHNRVRIKKNTVEFNTVAEGRGEIKTEIDKKIIPEARAYIEDTYVIQGIASYSYIGNRFYPGGGLTVGYRYRSYQFNAGFLVNQRSFSLVGSLSYMF